MTIAIKLPPFPFETTSGPMTFSDISADYALLYFYPKDNTSGCTQEATDFRDSFNDFTQANCTILGVSRDSIASHHKFIEQHALPFTLISDPDEAICNHFDVMAMKNMYGKRYRGIERSTFLFNKAGTLIAEWRKVKVTGHINEILTTLHTTQKDQAASSST